MTGTADFFSTLSRAGKETVTLQAGGWRAVVVPGLAGRVFVCRGESVLHRFDGSKVVSPSREPGVYNNYGGLNIWPAPEGGPFGWTYTPAGKWHVQDGVNADPFTLTGSSGSAARLSRTSRITNRKGREVTVTMRRNVELSISPTRTVDTCILRVTDRFSCPPARDVLISPWTLEQFDAHEGTTSFCVVADPRTAINFDFYEHPRERIVYRDGYFLYRTDSGKAGQIGIRRDAHPKAIGMMDARDGFLVVRTIIGKTGELTYFNIADNDQPRGPHSAADVFSIFNGPPELGFLELETIGGCTMENDMLVPHDLQSQSAYSVGTPEALAAAVRDGYGVDFQP